MKKIIAILVGLFLIGCDNIIIRDTSIKEKVETVRYISGSFVNPKTLITTMDNGYTINEIIAVPKVISVLNRLRIKLLVKGKEKIICRDTYVVIGDHGYMVSSICDDDEL